MKPSVVTLAAVILGFLTGALLKRTKEERSSPAATAAEGTRAVPRPPAAGTAARASGSVDTIASLLELDDLKLYPRLAPWLLDASGEEMAGFWTGYAKRSPGNWQGQVIFLLLSQWTRVDPEAAIAAMKDSPYGSLEWRAWATHESEAAMAAARGAAEFIRAAVIAAVCSADPRRGVRLMEENPEFRSRYGIWEISANLARKDPAAALDLQRKHWMSEGSGILEEWVSRDPRAALEWLAKNPKRPGEEGYRIRFVEALERENPDLLAEFAAMAPSGELKRNLEEAAFRKLVKDDRQAALAMARSSESPRVAAERFAAVGNAHAKDDPQVALKVFGEMLAALNTLKPHLYRGYVYPGGGIGGKVHPTKGTLELTERLVKLDPAAALAIAMEHTTAEYRLVEEVALRWKKADPGAARSWLEKAEVPENHRKVLETHLAPP